MVHWAEVDDVLNEINRQAIFFRYSNGGITFSGGEATAQPEFLEDLAKRLYDENISMALESCGLFELDRLLPVLRKMDLIFIDLKHLDPEIHRTYTGAGNSVILANIHKIAKTGLPLVVRIPVIMGFNGDDTAMCAAFDFLHNCAPGIKLELLPYHRYGEVKYKKLGLGLPDAKFKTPSRGQVAHWEALAREYGLDVVSYR